MGWRNALAPLVTEPRRPGLSLGRVGFWITFGICIWHWTVLRRDVPPNLWFTLGVFLAYNFGKKTKLAALPTKEDGA